MKAKINFNLSFFYLLFVLGIVYTISSPVLIEIGDDLGRNISDTGLIFSFYFAGFISGSLLSSIITRYFNRKKLILFFIFLITVSTFSVYFLFTYIFLLLMFFLTGISNGFIESQASILMIEVNRENEGLFVNLSQVFFGLGAFAGPLLPVAFIKTSMDWKYIYLTVSALCLIGFIFLALVKFPEYSKYSVSGYIKKPGTLYNIKEETSQGFKIKKNPVFIFLMLAMFFYVCAETGLATWIPTFLRLNKYFSPVLAGQVLSFFWLATFTGRILTGFLTRKIKTANILLFSLVLTIFFLLAGTYLDSVFFVLISFVMAGLFLSGIWPLIVTMGGIEYPSERNFIVSVIILSGGVGGLSAHWFLRWILNNFNLFTAFNFNYIFLFFSAVVIFFIYFYKKKKDRLENIRNRV